MGGVDTKTCSLWNLINSGEDLEEDEEDQGGGSSDEEKKKMEKQQRKRKRRYINPRYQSNLYEYLLPIAEVAYTSTTPAASPASGRHNPGGGKTNTLRLHYHTSGLSRNSLVVAGVQLWKGYYLDGWQSQRISKKISRVMSACQADSELVTTCCVQDM